MTSIIDLTMNDFQHIFGYLDYFSLINLSLTNIYLKNAVKEFSSSLSVRKILILCGKSTNLLCGLKGILTKFQYVLQFIRLFGYQFNIITFWVTDEKKCQLLAFYLSVYCPNIKTLLFRSMKFDLSPFFKVSRSVENLLFEFSILSPNFCQLFKFFPNLKSLSIFNTKIDQFDSFNEKHPYLEYITVDDLTGFMSFIKLQSNIKYFCISDWKLYISERKEKYGI